MENFIGSCLAGPEHKHFYTLTDIFPNICPNYLRKLCLGKNETDDVLDELTLELLNLNGNYKRVQRPLTTSEAKDVINKHQTLISLLPDADPNYLMDQAKNLIRDQTALDFFVNDLIEEKKYPLKTNYLRNIELQEEEQKYVKKFDIQYFFKNIPKPDEYFENKNFSYEDSDDYYYALTFLKEKYNFLHVKEIIKIFDSANCSVIQAAKILDTKIPTVRVEEQKSLVNCKNISLLQEIAYVQNKTDISDFIKVQNEQILRAKKLAEEAGFFYTCECCFSEEVTPYDIVSCQSGHVFCSECVRKSCEVLVGDGKNDFPCLAVCGSQFSLRVLQSVLPQKMFSKMAQRKQLDEVRQAEIDDLVFCPFCDFATILPPQDKVVHCLNHECLKETCRLCKRVSHIPFTCHEIDEKEKTEKQDTHNRLYIEEKMTEALLRTCTRCSKSFLKESGCNKMTCACGAIMCYVCKKPISDYNHFRENGGGICPLYSDIKRLHNENVQNGAQRAKDELRNVNQNM